MQIIFSSQEMQDQITRRNGQSRDYNSAENRLQGEKWELSTDAGKEAIFIPSCEFSPFLFLNK